MPQHHAPRPVAADAELRLGHLSDRQLDALLPDDEPDPDPRDFGALDLDADLTEAA